VTYVADLKAGIDDLFSGRVYRNQAPPGVTFPYVTIFDNIVRLPSMHGDGRSLAQKRRAQVSIWEQVGAESEDLVNQTLAALEEVTAADTRTHPTIDYVRRAGYDPTEPNVAHTVIWVSVGQRL
jgi:hypothetical protein